jgi:cephalosporin hydroxylase
MNIDKLDEIEDQSRRSAESWAPAWHAWYEGVAKHYPKGSGVEVGVAYGGHLVFLRDRLPDAHLCGIDPYQPYTVAGDAMDRSHADFDIMESWVRNRLWSLDVHLFRATSAWAAAHRYRKNSRSDWVFLDGAHDYESIRADIEAWSPLCTILGGHDFCAGWPGVMQAVTEEWRRRRAKNPFCELRINEGSGVWFLTC